VLCLRFFLTTPPSIHSFFPPVTTTGKPKRFFSSGAYRDAWKFQRRDEEFVLKRLQHSESYSFRAKDFFKIQREALIFDQLTTVPLVLNIYGYCGGSVVVEAMAADLHKIVIPGDGQASQSKLDQIPIDQPLGQNSLTVPEKLQIALEMAESLASLHGYNGGLIIHSDTHPEQWLFDTNGTAKLNDFNNAYLPTWSMERGDYCTRQVSYGGTVSSSRVDGQCLSVFQTIGDNQQKRPCFLGTDALSNPFFHR
jgi:serine/threonine protein kinase